MFLTIRRWPSALSSAVRGVSWSTASFSWQISMKLLAVASSSNTIIPQMNMASSAGRNRKLFWCLKLLAFRTQYFSIWSLFPAILIWYSLTSLNNIVMFGSFAYLRIQYLDIIKLRWNNRQYFLLSCRIFINILSISEYS